MEHGHVVFFDLETQKEEPVRLLLWGQFSSPSAWLFLELPQIATTRFLSVVLIDAYDERAKRSMLTKGVPGFVDVPLILPYGEIVPSLLSDSD